MVHPTDSTLSYLLWVLYRSVINVYVIVFLGGVMVIGLAVGLNVRGFVPSRDGGFLRTIKICSIA
jgi:hypothetical protein